MHSKDFQNCYEFFSYTKALEYSFEESFLEVIFFFFFTNNEMVSFFFFRNFSSCVAIIMSAQPAPGEHATGRPRRQSESKKRALISCQCQVVDTTERSTFQPFLFGQQCQPF